MRPLYQKAAHISELPFALTGPFVSIRSTAHAYVGGAGRESMSEGPPP